MHHPPQQRSNVYGLGCIRCGCALELPYDPRLVHIDCPYCGQDNVLPQHLIEARQRQHALELDHHTRARAAEQQRLAQQSRSRVTLFLVLGIGFAVFVLFGTCVFVGHRLNQEEEREKIRAQDPALNGQNAMHALLERMRKENGCERILSQPEMHFKKEGTISLNMIAGDSCVHLLGTTEGTQSIALKYTSNVALSQPLPAPAKVVDYRLCASQTAPHAFAFSTVNEPFTIAAIECPRKSSEGGSRAKANDVLTTGKSRIALRLGELKQAGCKSVIAEPSVSRGTQTFTLTSPANGPCFNMLISSHFADVSFAVAIHDPSGKSLPAPRPASEVRVMYCPIQAGKYSLVVTPSTSDHYAHVSLDCPRFGAEGLKREREFKKNAVQ
jgi:hypothetical protein